MMISSVHTVTGSPIVRLSSLPGVIFQKAYNSLMQMFLEPMEPTL